MLWGSYACFMHIGVCSGEQHKMWKDRLWQQTNSVYMLKNCDLSHLPSVCSAFIPKIFIPHDKPRDLKVWIAPSSLDCSIKCGLTFHMIKSSNMFPLFISILRKLLDFLKKQNHTQLELYLYFSVGAVRYRFIYIIFPLGQEFLIPLPTFPSLKNTFLPV